MSTGPAGPAVTGTSAGGSAVPVPSAPSSSGPAGAGGSAAAPVSGPPTVWKTDGTDELASYCQGNQKCLGDLTADEIAGFVNAGQSQFLKSYMIESLSPDEVRKIDDNIAKRLVVETPNEEFVAAQNGNNALSGWILEQKIQDPPGKNSSEGFKTAISQLSGLKESADTAFQEFEQAFNIQSARFQQLSAQVAQFLPEPNDSVIKELKTDLQSKFEVLGKVLEEINKEVRFIYQALQIAGKASADSIAAVLDFLENNGKKPQEALNSQLKWLDILNNNPSTTIKFYESLCKILIGKVIDIYEAVFRILGKFHELFEKIPRIDRVLKSLNRVTPLIQSIFDLNNALFGSIGDSEISSHPSPEIRKTLDEISRSSGKLTKLITDFFKYFEPFTEEASSLINYQRLSAIWENGSKILSKILNDTTNGLLAAMVTVRGGFGFHNDEDQKRMIDPNNFQASVLNLITTVWNWQETSEDAVKAFSPKTLSILNDFIETITTPNSGLESIVTNITGEIAKTINDFSEVTQPIDAILKNQLMQKDPNDIEAVFHKPKEQANVIVTLFQEIIQQYIVFKESLYKILAEFLVAGGLRNNFLKNNQTSHKTYLEIKTVVENVKVQRDSRVPVTGFYETAYENSVKFLNEIGKILNNLNQKHEALSSQWDILRRFNWNTYFEQLTKSLQDAQTALTDDSQELPVLASDTTNHFKGLVDNLRELFRAEILSQEIQKLSYDNVKESENALRKVSRILTDVQGKRVTEKESIAGGDAGLLKDPRSDIILEKQLRDMNVALTNPSTEAFKSLPLSSLSIIARIIELDPTAKSIIESQEDTSSASQRLLELARSLNPSSLKIANTLLTTDSNGNKKYQLVAGVSWEEIIKSLFQALSSRSSEIERASGEVPPKPITIDGSKAQIVAPLTIPTIPANAVTPEFAMMIGRALVSKGASIERLDLEILDYMIAGFIHNTGALTQEDANYSVAVAMSTPERLSHCLQNCSVDKIIRSLLPASYQHRAALEGTMEKYRLEYSYSATTGQPSSPVERYAFSLSSKPVPLPDNFDTVIRNLARQEPEAMELIQRFETYERDRTPDSYSSLVEMYRHVMGGNVASDRRSTRSS